MSVLGDDVTRRSQKPLPTLYVLDEFTVAAQAVMPQT
jgi:hypothetical protein